MDKLQIKIRGRSYTLRTDESPERIAQIASSLDEKIAEFAQNMKGMPEAEMLTLIAFDLMEQSDNASAEVVKLKDLLDDTETKNKQLLIENMNSAESELYQIAVIKEQENNELRAKIQDYEQMWDNHASKAYSSAGDEMALIAMVKEQEDNALRSRIHELENQWAAHSSDTYESAIKEANEVAESKERENQKLNTMLENFEKTFDNFAKTKEREIIRMQEEIEALKLRLAETSDDGQITLV